MATLNPKLLGRAFAGFLISLPLMTSVPTLGQTITQPSSNSVLVSQISNSFSNGEVVHNIQISGNAMWYLGNQGDSGSVVLTASSDGQSEVQLDLQTLGQRTETQAAGTPPDAACAWSGSDGVVHQIHTSNCSKPLLWFLPCFSLQSSLSSDNVDLVDLGIETDGLAQAYRHVRIQLSSSTSDSIPADFTSRTAMDLELSPQVLLPASLTYTITPDDGASTPIPFKILYSDYRSVDGVEIPFLIQRYANGALQLEIHVSSVSVN